MELTIRRRQVAPAPIVGTPLRDAGSAGAPMAGLAVIAASPRIRPDSSAPSDARTVYGSAIRAFIGVSLSAAKRPVITAADTEIEETIPRSCRQDRAAQARALA